MKFYLVQIQLRSYDDDAINSFVVKTKKDLDLEKEWKKDHNISEDDDPEYETGSGNTAQIYNIEEIPEEDFIILSKYFSEYIFIEGNIK